MGSSDLYCDICGGPTYSRPIITNTLLLKKYLGKGEYYGIKPNGLWDNAEELINFIKKHYKKLGLPKMDDEDYNILIKSINIPKEHKWQNKLTLFTEKKKIKDVISAGDPYIELDDGTKYEPTEFDNNGKQICYLVHNDCYKVLKSKYSKITFNDFLDIKSSSLLDDYQGQYFYSSLAYLVNPSLLESPLKNKNNKDNILKNNKDNILKNNLIINKNIKQIKKNRPSPSKSATLFDNGTKMKGNDGNIWIVTENKNKIKKWMKL